MDFNHSIVLLAAMGRRNTKGVDNGLYRTSFRHSTGWRQWDTRNGAISHSSVRALALVVRAPAENALAGPNLTLTLVTNCLEWLGS